MSWPVPTPAQHADRAAQVYEARLPGIDARSRNRVATATCRVVGVTATSMHMHIAAQAVELMPSTAVETLDAKAGEWGLTREPARFAVGTGIINGGDPGTPVPAGALLGAGAVLVKVAAAAVLDANGAAGVALVALLAGAAGEVAADTVLVPSSPIEGLNPQQVVVDGAGIVGGLDAESDDDLRARLLIEVRKGDEDGAVYYRRLALAVYAAAIVAVIPASAGPGSVSVVFAMPGPRAPTPAEVAAVDAAVQAGRSVGVRRAFTIGATLHPVDVQIHLNPDAAATRAAALAGLQASFAADAAIGGAVFASRLDAAISNLSGEYSHERLAPAGDVALAPTEVATLGVLSFA